MIGIITAGTPQLLPVVKDSMATTTYYYHRRNHVFGTFHAASAVIVEFHDLERYVHHRTYGDGYHGAFHEHSQNSPDYQYGQRYDKEQALPRSDLYDFCIILTLIEVGAAITVHVPAAVYSLISSLHHPHLGQPACREQEYYQYCREGDQL